MQSLTPHSPKTEGLPFPYQLSPYFGGFGTS